MCVSSIFGSRNDRIKKTKTTHAKVKIEIHLNKSLPFMINRRIFFYQRFEFNWTQQKKAECSLKIQFVAIRSFQLWIAFQTLEKKDCFCLRETIIIILWTLNYNVKTSQRHDHLQSVRVLCCETFAPEYPWLHRPRLGRAPFFVEWFWKFRMFRFSNGNFIHFVNGSTEWKIVWQSTVCLFSTAKTNCINVW